jgi:hypothetical protein
VASIVPFLRPHGSLFDDEVTRLMGEAFDMAAKSLDGAPSAVVYEAIASRIVVAAQRGERDPRQLCRAGMAGIGKCC